MTSGMSAKGSALGASVPESGVASNRAPAPRAPESAGNGAGRGHAVTIGTESVEAGIGETEGTFAGSIGAGSVPPTLSESVRTLILGIDYDGRIVQYDRNAPRILAREPDELLGAQLSDLTVSAASNAAHAARPMDGVAAVGGLLEAIRSRGQRHADHRDARRPPGGGGGDGPPDARRRHQPGRAGPAAHPGAAGRAVRRSRGHAQADAGRHLHQDRRHARHRPPGP